MLKVSGAKKARKFYAAAKSVWKIVRVQYHANTNELSYTLDPCRKNLKNRNPLTRKIITERELQLGANKKVGNKKNYRRIYYH
jgi:hypothetical protein